MSLINSDRSDSAPAEKWVQRFDRAAAQLDPAEKTPQGYLRMHAAIAVPGVMEYLNADGTITRELLPPETLHDAESLITLASVPATLDHPDEDVTPDNVGKYGVGDVGENVEVLAETGHVRITMVVRRKDALDAIDDGVEEVSPGYKCLVDPTPGVHPVFGPYDAVQRARRYNHLAIVKQARGGSTVKLRADAAPGSAQAVHRVDAATPARPGVAMNPFLLMLASLVSVDPGTRRADGKYVRKDGVEVTEEMLASAIQSAIAGLQGGADEEDPQVAELKAKIAELQTQLATLTGENATMKADAKAREDAARAAADADERKWLDLLAKSDGVKCPTESWRDDTKNDVRKLDIARHMKLVAKDATPAAPEVHGMVLALKHLHLDSKTETGRTDAASTEHKTDGAWSAGNLDTDKPATGRADRSANPFAEGLAKSKSKAA